MKCVKCDICGKYVTVWHEVKFSDIFSWWRNHGSCVQAEEICLECKEKIRKEVYKVIAEIKSNLGEEIYG